MSNKLNLELKQGEDFYRLLTIKDEDRNPVDLTGYTFTGQIRACYSGELFLSFAFNLKDQDDFPGQVEMSLPRALSSAKEILGKSNYLYDVEMNSGSSVTRIMEGTIILNPEVTR